MPTLHRLTDTEKSSVPYKTPLKNHRERTILGVFVKLGVRRLILISQILIIYLPGDISRPGALGYQFLTSHLQHYSGSPRITPARPELPWLTQGQQLIQDHLKPCTASQAWPPPQAQHLKPCAASQSLRSPLMLCKTLQTPHTPSSLVRRNGKLQRQPLGLLAQTPHSVRVLLHKPRPGAPSGIGELFDAVDH